MMNVVMNPDLSEKFDDVDSVLRSIDSHIAFVNGRIYERVMDGEIKSIQRGRFSQSVRSQDVGMVTLSAVKADRSLATFSCSTRTGSNTVYGWLEPDGLVVLFRNTDEDNDQWLDCSWEVIEYV